MLPKKDDFPNKIVVGENEYKRFYPENEISGLNPKACYRNKEGEEFILKMEKVRLSQDIFKLADEKITTKIYDGGKLFNSSLMHARQQHVNQLRDSVTATAVIASHIAKKLFNKLLEVPENILIRLPDGQPAVLSKCLPNTLKFDEFLSRTDKILAAKKIAKENKKPLKPSDWKEQLGIDELTIKGQSLTPEQAHVLGQIFYVALMMGHWDALNNIDLSNSGSIEKSNKLIACIVDWGNCLGVGFGGLSQDSTAFENSEFTELEIDDKKGPIEGFRGAVPFNEIVYPIVPRQLVKDLFNLDPSSTHPLMQAMIAGFKEEHKKAMESKGRMGTLIEEAITESLPPGETEFKKSLSPIFFKEINTPELDKKNNKNTSISGTKPELADILEGRLESLEEMIQELSLKKTMNEIGKEQFEKIKKSQRIEMNPRTM